MPTIRLCVCWRSIFVRIFYHFYLPFLYDFNKLCRFIYFYYFYFLHRTECFCGNTIPEDTVKLPDPQCNHKCSGDSKQICGGYFTVSIFETGIKRK